MSDDLDGGGQKQAPKMKIRTPERRSVRGIVITFIGIWMLMVSSYGFWDLHVRSWSLDQVAETMIVDDWGYDVGGFDPQMAGRTIRVEGEVTWVDRHLTNQGLLTLIELDNSFPLRLVQWDGPQVNVGDTVVREVHFENARFNEMTMVTSQQLSWPGLEAVVNWEEGYGGTGACDGGICLLASSIPSQGLVHIEVFLPEETAFPLELFYVTLYRGIGIGHTEFDETLGVYPEIDYLTPLRPGRTQIGNLQFVDHNSNGMLDNGDYFEVSVTRPNDHGEFLTYLLQINDLYEWPYVLSGSCYLAMTNQGVLKWIGVNESELLPFPGAFLFYGSEAEGTNGISAEVIISETWGPSVPIHRGGCMLRHLVRIPFERDKYICRSLSDVPVVSRDNITISFSDADSDGFLSPGDGFLISGMLNHSNYEFYLTGFSDVWQHPLTWATGVGVETGNLAVVEWDEPVALDVPTNRSFRVGIREMYGVPGVSMESNRYWIDVLVSRNSDYVYISRIRGAFSFTSQDMRIELIDADVNGYFNQGDYFLCDAFESGEITITLRFYNSLKFYMHDLSHIAWSVSFTAN